VLAKAEEEIAELKTALAGAMSEPPVLDKVSEEFGDLLFVMANIAGHLKSDQEGATALRAEGRTPEDATLEEMDQLWDEAKAVEK
jgi:nucleoside triphosphate diphosphatase